MNQINPNPIKNTPKQKPNPPADCPFDYPWTIKERNIPKRNPEKLPIANSRPAAAPSPTGKAVSHANSSIIGTKGIRKNELYAETRLASANTLVSSRG